MTTRRPGFTLVEILVGLAIFAALLTLLIPALNRVMARSQTAQNMANMSLTMKDFFVWSNMNNGRMVNAGLPPGDDAEHWFYSMGYQSTYDGQVFLYRSHDSGWPLVLHHAFGESSPHWQSSFANVDQWLPRGMTEQEVRGRDPGWFWRLPSDFLYTITMLTKPTAWQFPGLGLAGDRDYAKYYSYVGQADIAHPATKGVLWHNHVEPGPGRQRLVAFADGAVSQRDMTAARPAAAHPMNPDRTERGGAIVATLRGAHGRDF